MKKKISMLVLCGVMLLGLCGCGKKDITQKNDSKDTNQNEKLTSVGTLTNLEENIVLVNNSFLVTDNNIYVVSFDKLFSNDSNYKKLGTDNNIIGIDMDDWGYFHILNDKQRIMTCSMENNCSGLSNGAKLVNHISLLNGSSLTGKFLYISDGKLYFATKGLYLDSEGHNQSNAILIDTTDSIGNEKVVAIYLSNNKYYLKTDKAFYRFKENKVATNKEECEKYVDIECNYEYQYGITKENTLTEHYKDIKYIANDKIVFNDNKVYSLN